MPSQPGCDGAEEKTGGTYVCSRLVGGCGCLLCVGVGVGVGFADVVVGAAPLPNSHSPYSSPPIDGSKNANRPSVRSRLLYPHPTHCSASRQFVHFCTYSRTGRSAYAS